MKSFFSLLLLIIFTVWSALVVANVTNLNPSNNSKQAPVPYELPVEEIPSEIEEEVKQFNLTQEIEIPYMVEVFKTNSPQEHFKKYYQQIYFEVLTPPPDLAV